MAPTGRQVTGVRIELTYEDGTTREVVRLTNIEPTSFRVETDYDSRQWPEERGMWMEQVSTGYARVKLDAFGRKLEAERSTHHEVTAEWDDDRQLAVAHALGRIEGHVEGAKAREMTQTDALGGIEHTLRTLYRRVGMQWHSRPASFGNE